MKTLVKVEVKVFSEEGRYTLAEIKGLKEGMEIIGTWDDQNNAVEFTWNGLDAVLWAGDNCIITEEVAVEYVVAKENNIESAEESEDIFAELSEAKDYMKLFGGYIFYAAYWCNDGYMTIPCYAKSEKTAINKLMRNSK